ncbi:hypothetical protein BKA00_000448 [Actinomadura coerulea]|uniref:Uncharacterized protein n=1 Tax=Actinomadura coerulea TaxID=46159 RepID=A0A7X0FTS0_9ACTN|nr:hypothetical protein [Actinomadura coerulea]MBB6393534.1 hypothetical protein [Actinomadura coerulea]GGP92185.1 hypothetical protein GCM10010187_04520 [Actinomadura coerulea]
MAIIAEGDLTRAGYIAGLRQLADLLEAQPDIPHYQHGRLNFALDGTETEAAETIERTAAALTAAGIEFNRRDTDHAQAIEFVLAGVEYGFSRVHDAAWAVHKAQQSYEENVQVALPC